MQGRFATIAMTLALAVWNSPTLAQQANTIPSNAQYDGFLKTADASCEEDRWPLRAHVSDGRIVIGNGSGAIAADGTFDFKYPRGADEFRFHGKVESDVVSGTFELLPFAHCLYEFEARR